MKNLRFLKLFVFALALGGLMAAQSLVSCPAFQHDDGTGNCQFNSYYDTPGYLTAQNQAIANSLNASPAALQGFMRTYGSLPLNQQNAIQVCQLAIVDAQIWPSLYSVPASCPVSNGVLNIAALLVATPAPSNPGNQPSVTWNGSQFVPAIPPPAGPAIPIAAPAPVSGGNLVGPLAFGNTYMPGPGAMTNSTTPAVTDGQKVTQNGKGYTAHVTQGLMGIEVTFSQP